MNIKKALKRGIKKIFYLNLSVKIGNKSFIVPIVKGVGIDNLKLKNDWFLLLLNKVSLPENSTFIDVGVNVGQTILKFRSRFNNPYLGFEINSNCVNYTRNLIRINKIKDISIFPVGLSDKDEVTVLNSTSEIVNCLSDATIVSDLRPNLYNDDDKSFAPVFKFDNLKLFDLGGNLSMVKIDVEGAEFEVINGMLETINNFRPLIVCEVLDYNSALTSVKLQDRANKLCDLIQSLSYDIYLIKHSYLTLKFEKISKINLVLWTSDSYELNDYLFVPIDKHFINLSK